MPKLHTLTGNLGGDVEIRDSQARWEIQETTRWDPVAEMRITEEVERYRRSRPYGRVSLACHGYDEQGQQTTRWHQLVIWDLHRMDRFNVRLARKGDRVKVEGFFQTFTYTDEDGEERRLERFIVTRYMTLRRKGSNGAVLSNNPARRAAAAMRQAIAEAHKAQPEQEETAEASTTATECRKPSRRSFRGTWTTRATVENRTVKGSFVVLEIRTATGRTSRVSGVLGSPLGDALAWLQAKDTVRLTFRRQDGPPRLVHVEWDWEAGEPAERQLPTPQPAAQPAARSTARPVSQPIRQAPPFPTAAALGPIRLSVRVATDPETCQGWRALTVETDDGELYRVGAQLGTRAAAELTHLQEGDRVRIEGRQLRDDRIHADQVEPVYLRGTVPTFTREQAYRPEMYA
jgi:single-stranded DNA-binding protein